MHRVQVVGRVQAARDVVTLWLAVPGTLRAPAPYRPGQFITLALSTDRGTLYRSYSLCGDGSPDRPWEITIKRQHAGVVSSYMYDRVAPGQILQVSGPAGTFTLPQTLRPGAPLVFIALGSGITPIYGMLRALKRLAPERRPRVQLHYAYSTPADAIYARELAQLDPQREWLAQYHYVSSRGSRLTTEYVLRLAGDETQDAEWYICGSGEFKRGMEGALMRHGVASSQIHAEMFASPRASASMSGTFSGVLPIAGETGRARAGGASVRLADEDRVLAARPGETLLETLERGGYHPAFSCRAGACGTCRLRVLAGQVTSDGDSALTPQERAAGYVLSCVARPVGEVTLASVSAGGSELAGIAGGRRAGATRPAARILLRSALIAASLALFVRAWTLTSQPIVAHAASSDTTLQPSGSAACQSGDSHHEGDDEGHDDKDHNDDHAVCVAPSPTPSGPSGASGIWTQPTVPTPPSTSSGASR